MTSTNTIVRITKKFSFDMAHALSTYDGACKNIHGHTYILSVTVKGPINSDAGDPRVGMVMDFSDLKAIVKREVLEMFDHTLVLQKDSHHAKATSLLHDHERVILVDYPPSAENLMLDFLGRIQRCLPASIQLHALKLEETPTSFAEWFADDNL